MNGHRDETGDRQSPSTHSDESDGESAPLQDDANKNKKLRTRNLRNKKMKVWDNHNYHYGAYGATYGNKMSRFGINLNFLDNRNRNGTAPRNRKKEISLSAPPSLLRGCPSPILMKDRDRLFIIVSTSMYHSGYKYHSNYNLNNINNSINSNKSISNEGCIFKYDLFNDSWDKFKKYRNINANSSQSQPQSVAFKPYNHGHAINAESNELYIFGGAHKTFATFDLNGWSDSGDKIYDISKHTDMTYCYPVSIFIRNELHIFAQIAHKSLHSIYFAKKLQIRKDFIEEQREEIDEMNEIPNFYCCKVIFVEHLEEILIFNGHNSNVKIWSYSLIDRKWKLFKTKTNHKNLYLPKQNTNNFNVCLVHDRIILICYNLCKEAWCFNLDSDTTTNKWSRKNCKNILLNAINDDCSILNIENNFIHFINTISPQHYMVWVYHLLTRKILKRVYTPMVIQYYFTKRSGKCMNKKMTNLIVKLIADYCSNIFY